MNKVIGIRLNMFFDAWDPVNNLSFGMSQVFPSAP